MQGLLDVRRGPTKPWGPSLGWGLGATSERHGQPSGCSATGGRRSWAPRSSASPGPVITHTGGGKQPAPRALCLAWPHTGTTACSAAGPPGGGPRPPDSCTLGHAHQRGSRPSCGASRPNCMVSSPGGGEATPGHRAPPPSEGRLMSGSQGKT